MPVVLGWRGAKQATLTWMFCHLPVDKNMDTPEEPKNEPEAPAKQADPKRTAVIVVVIVVVAAFAWALGSKYFAVAAAEKQGVMQSAAATSSALAPLLDMNSKDQLSDGTALQRVVDDIVGSKRFTFAAVLDSSGRVIVSSDRNTSLGSEYPGFKVNEVVEGDRDGGFEVIYPVKHETVTYGAIVLRGP